ncbi:DUF4397 domain-containing protein [Pedobacter soli]|uniref:DUF4397 domain-containing protein n=1 Tax=Pedobacter soli TaxID=390242 RepID=A0A1G6XUN1_9SPHI|nr:DUF4397 domain-containing protein [Pedobacter soli]SDD81125.1 protein of unknown function [Pedobacter soli]
MKFLKNIHQLKELTFTHTLVLAAWVLVAILPSCKKTEYLDTDNADREPLSAKVKLVNALSITAPVNFLDFTRQINTTLVAHNVATAYLDTQFGKVQYNTTEGSNTSYKSSYIFGGATSFAQETDKASFAGPNGPIAGYYHTLFTVAKRRPSKLNPGNRDSLVLVYDDLTAPAAGKAKIRFANFAPDAPNLDLKTTAGTSWFANVAYGNFGDQVQLTYDASGKAPATIAGLSWKTLGPFKEVAAGAAQNLELRNNSTGAIVPVKTAALSNLSFEEGKIYTLFINGNLTTDAALQATLIVHTK